MSSPLGVTPHAASALHTRCEVVLKAVKPRQTTTSGVAITELDDATADLCLPDNTRPCTMAKGGHSAAIVGAWKGGVRWARRRSTPTRQAIAAVYLVVGL